MQLYVIDWSFQNSEDQLFATNEFCEYLKQNKFNNIYQEFELIFIAHTPQNGSGTIICKAKNEKSIYYPLKMWRESYSIEFNIKPALTNEELVEIQSSKDCWEDN